MNAIKYIIVLIAVAFAIACGQAASTPITANNTAPKTNTNTTNAATPASSIPLTVSDSGKDLYAKNCMICHKENGTGGKVTIEGKSIDPPDMTTEKMKAKSDDKFVQYITEGFPDDGMPAFKGKLNEDQIKTIVKHVRELQGS